MLPLFAQLDESLYPSTESSKAENTNVAVYCLALLKELLDSRGNNNNDFIE